MAYSRHLPIFAIVEDGLKREGLLEPGYDWYVLSLPLETSQLNCQQFTGILSDWKEKILKYQHNQRAFPDASEMTVAQLAGSLKPVQLWSLLLVLAGLIGSAFTLGTQFRELSPKQSQAIHQESRLQLHALHLLLQTVR